MEVINVKSPDQFTSTIKSENPSVVLFSAPWAAQCQQILDVFKTMSTNDDFKHLKFLNCDAEELAQISEQFNIQLVPTTLIFMNGKETERVEGVKVAELTNICRQTKLIKSDGTSMSLNDRLKALVNKSKVMIFMKGNRDTPRCGFSKQLIAIINETGVPYETFDILSDEEVRQGLKVFSDWPTYPQLYVNGDLIGGLDIIKEMLTNNELVSTLTG